MSNEMTAEKALRILDDFVPGGCGGEPTIHEAWKALSVLRSALAENDELKIIASVGHGRREKILRLLAENESLRVELSRLKAGPTDDHSAEMLDLIQAYEPPTDRERTRLLADLDEAWGRRHDGKRYFLPSYERIRALIAASSNTRPRVTTKELVGAYTGGLYGYEFERLADLLRKKGVEVIEEEKP